MSSEMKAICPSCQQEIPVQASICPHCRYSFAGYADYAPVEKKEPAGGGLWASLRRHLSGAGDQSGSPPASTAEGESPEKPPVESPATAPLMKAPAPLEVGDLINGRYRVEQVYPLDTCTFYRTAIPGEQPALYLVRESDRPAAGARRVSELFEQPLPHVARHRERFQVEGRTYTVLDHPGQGWRSLARVRVPLGEGALAFTWTHQLAQALAALHRAGYGEWPAGPAGREGILIDQDGEILIADLSLAQPAGENTVRADSHILLSLLIYLSSGQSWQPSAPPPAELPPAVQAVVARFGTGASPDFEALLALLAAAPEPTGATAEQPVPAAGPGPTLHQLAGIATDVGRERSNNQDMVAALHFSLDQSGDSVPQGLYVVADGMGGHAAGEKASRDAIRAAFLEFLQSRIVPELEGETRDLAPEGPGARLRQIVEKANQIVYESRIASGTDRGTTITAALIAGNRALVANVGDSRTYRFRQGDPEQELRKITADHSIVAGLIQAGEISEEEAYSHPDRNQIYRSLGATPDVQVDLFEETVAAGDRLLLCSDGLWEMVRDPAIATVLRSTPNPQEACDRLVALANQGGGEDNISVILVDMV